ncbi:MAG: hypothetical protein HY652_10990 [Acidobacteria bacterium]|nr:hypothetical protein [Acidobacteriota bacterium]
MTPSSHRLQRAGVVALTSLAGLAGAAAAWALFAGAAFDEERKTVDADRAPRRVIRDPDPTYSAIAVDPVRNEVALQDENLFQILMYDRLDNTPARAAMTEPIRVIGGKKTKVEFNCGLYVDRTNGDVYSVNNDTVDTMVVFSREAKGNVAPDRELHTPHRTFGIAVDEESQELFLTVQHPPKVVVYRKMASGEEKPIRTLEGPNTQLEDAHGIAVDMKSNLIFVSNHGSASNANVAGSGRFEPPSITVYPLKASGDSRPLRVIEGSKTQLNWPAGIYLDPEHGELYVANDVGDSILVFRTTDGGNVAPTRVLKGPKTGIKNPTGVFVDTKNQELWVSNMGNHAATVYPRTAEGDTAPLRTIRAAPRGKLALAIGNPGAVAYDSKRQEILVPN